MPAVVLLGIVVAVVVRAWPLPASVPVHFDLAGRPDRFASPWVAVLGFTLLPLAVIIAGIFLDEVWARQERRKRFNWVSLIDELIVGIIGAGAVDYFPRVAGGQTNIAPPWRMMGLWALIAVAAAWVLEIMRRHEPTEPVRAGAEAAGEVAEMREKMRRGSGGGTGRRRARGGGSLFSAGWRLCWRSSR